jgi:hypothetical protein
MTYFPSVSLNNVAHHRVCYQLQRVDRFQASLLVSYRELSLLQQPTNQLTDRISKYRSLLIRPLFCSMLQPTKRMLYCTTCSFADGSLTYCCMYSVPHWVELDESSNGRGEQAFMMWPAYV